ncbi:MAG TPA: ATP-binding protein, partial [Verrucomicrobiae bacterium]|nr:ATP-binding protein [Verrucomicrobiae bacterium]
PGMLEQVLVNLVVNARDAMPNGGRLRIATGLVNFNLSYSQSHPEARPGDFVSLSVQDSGTGITPEHLPHIFEPFFTTKELGKGTGLGLATVYGIVKQHQGWVEVNSTVGRGATFRVLVPALAPTADAGLREELEVPLRGGTETILLVEDEAAVRMVTRRLLESFGYKVLEAANSHEALERFQSASRDCALLLTDIVLAEGVTGLELADRLRTRNPGLKVIFMSGYSSEMAGKDTGFFERSKSRFLQKPFDSRALILAVRSSLDEMVRVPGRLGRLPT